MPVQTHTGATGERGYSDDAKVANRSVRDLHGGDREWPLNDGQNPNPNVARVAFGTGYHIV